MRQDRLKVGGLLVFLFATIGLLGFYSGQPSVDVGTNFGRPVFEMPEDPTQPWIEQVSWSPRVFIYHNMLTPEECESIIEIGKQDLSESKVVAASGQC